MLNPILYTVPGESSSDRAIGYEDYCDWRDRFEEFQPQGEAMTEKEGTTPDEKNVAEMTSCELGAHIAVMEKRHRGHVNALRALKRVREMEEEQGN